MMLLRWALIQYNRGPYKMMKFGQTGTQGGECVKMKAAIRVMLLQAKEHQRSQQPFSQQLKEIHGTDSPSHSSEKKTKK